MNMDNAIIKMGKLYGLVYKFPKYGNKMVRRMCRNIAAMTFHAPFMKMKKHDTIDGVLDEFKKLGDLYRGEILISKQDDASFEYKSSPCPYGYNPTTQRGLCDAVMDMNRRLFDLCGAKLVIHERISAGAPQCRISIKMKEADCG